MCDDRPADAGTFYLPPLTRAAARTGGRVRSLVRTLEAFDYGTAWPRWRWEVQASLHRYHNDVAAATALADRQARFEEGYLAYLSARGDALVPPAEWSSGAAMAYLRRLVEVSLLTVDQLAVVLNTDVDRVLRVLEQPTSAYGYERRRLRRLLVEQWWDRTPAERAFERVAATRRRARQKLVDELASLVSILGRGPGAEDPCGHPAPAAAV